LLDVFCFVFGNECVALFLGEEGGGDWDGAGSVEDVDQRS